MARDFKHLPEDIRRIDEELEDLLQSRLPQKAVEIAEELVLDSFKEEAYQGRPGGGKWKRRKKPDKQKSRRNLLVQTGELRRSITVYYDRARESVIIATDREVGAWNLARIHNEGLKPVPQRQFMPLPGDPFPEWERRVDAWLEKELDKILS